MWQRGQRGSQRAIVRAIVNRAVTKLSGKWRSGREVLRTVVHRPSGRGGKTPHAFSNDERVAAESHRDVVMPTWKAPPFEVVEPEFAFEILVGALGAPPLHHDADELLLGHPLRKSGQEVIGRLRLILAPLDQQPLGVRSIGIRDHTSKCESCTEIPLRPLAPGAAPETATGVDREREVTNADRLPSWTRLAIDQGYRRLGLEPDRVSQLERPQSPSEFRGVSVRGDQRRLFLPVSDNYFCRSRRPF